MFQKSIVALLFLFLTATATTVTAQTLEEMAGQLIVVGFAGETLDDPDTRMIRDYIASGRIGGVMYLRRNVRSLADVLAMNAAFLAAHPDLPPLIALDQEGGFINRLSDAVGFAQIPSAQVMGQGTVYAARLIYADLAQRLSALGFNVNFGPVVDLNLNPENPIIARYERAFGVDPVQVAAFGAAFVEGHRAAGVLTALKHFPGHGSSTGDTHEGFVDVTAVWQPQELAPYRILIDAGLVDMVMAAHIYDARMADDDLQLPVSLSPTWIQGVLRGELGFDGVVISDDLGMGAVQSRFDLQQTIVRAVHAGNDILLFANFENYRPELAAEVHAILVAEARRDPAFAARIEESYRRIVTLKQQLAPLAETVVVQEIFRASTTADGGPIRMPDADELEVVVSIFEILPGARLPVHLHDYPRYAYVLAGTLHVTTVGDGREFVYRAGDFLIEVLSQWHYGANPGDTAVRLLVIDQAPRGESNTVPMQP